MGERAGSARTVSRPYPRVPVRRATHLVWVVAAGCAAGCVAGAVHVALGVGRDAGMFVAGLPWPWSGAVDAAAVLGAGTPAAVAGAACLAAVRAAAGWVLLRAAAEGVRLRAGPAVVAAALPAGGGTLVAALGVAGRPGLGVVMLAAVSAVCTVLAASACGRVVGWRAAAGGAVGMVLALLATPSDVRVGEVLPAACLAGSQGSLLLLGTLLLAPVRRGAAGERRRSRRPWPPSVSGPRA